LKLLSKVLSAESIQCYFQIYFVHGFCGFSLLPHHNDKLLLWREREVVIARAVSVMIVLLV